MSPDRSGAPEPIPYADLSDPQTLNLYGYVRNNPLGRTDADGHCFWDACILETIGATAIINAVGATAVVVGVGVILHELKTQGGVEVQAQDPDERNMRIMAGPKYLAQSDNPSPPAAGSDPQPQKTGNAEPPQLKAGKDAHNKEEVRPGEKKEVTTPSGDGRMDRYNADKRHIREIKPDNARGEKAGQKQLKRYKKEMDKTRGKPHTTELTKYPKPDPNTQR